MSIQSIYRASRLLTGQSIRLLRIVSLGTSLSCTLQSHGQQAPAYTALSYTWDNPLTGSDSATQSDDASSRQDRFINFGRVKFPVTENLFAALSSFASLGMKGPFWIDAICINQADVSEREAQVAMMGDIYARADEVIVWLGPESRKDADAIRLHTEFMPALRRHLGDRSNDPAALKSLQLSHLLELGILSDARLLESYSPFRRRGWFERAWIFQETLLAARIHYLCGRTFIERQDLDDLAIFDLACHQTVMAAFKDKVSVPYTSLRAVQNLRAVFDLDPAADLNSNLLNTRDRAIVRGTLQQPTSVWHSLSSSSPSNPTVIGASTIRAEFLLKFVNILRYRRCKDPRDKVYAAIGAINRLLPPKSHADEFKVQYGHISVQDVYYNFTCWVLSRVPQMIILSLIEDPSERRLNGLPSWVPDLSVTSEIQELVGKRLSLEDCEEPAATSLLLTRSISGNRLTALGVFLDDIVAVDSLPITDVLSNTSYSLRSLLEFAMDLEPMYPTGEQSIDALWRTLITNTDLSSEARMAGQAGREAVADMALSFRSYIIEKLAKTILQIGHARQESALPSPARPGPEASSSVAARQQQESTPRAVPNIDDFLAAHSPLLESLRETHSHGATSSVASPNSFPIPSMNDVVARLVSLGSEHPSPSASASESSSMSTTASASLESAPHQPFRYIQSLQIQGRRLFRSAKGYVGLAPRSARVADRICWFQATRMPFVLRRQLRSQASKEEIDGQDEVYEIIGEAYIYGLMDCMERGMKSSPGMPWRSVVLV